MFNVGLIRVITLDETQGLNAHGQLIESLYPGIAVESGCIPNQRPSRRSCRWPASVLMTRT